MSDLPNDRPGRVMLPTPPNMSREQLLDEVLRLSVEVHHCYGVIDDLRRKIFRAYYDEDALE